MRTFPSTVLLIVAIVAATIASALPGNSLDVSREKRYVWLALNDTGDYAFNSTLIEPTTSSVTKPLDTPSTTEKSADSKSSGSKDSVSRDSFSRDSDSNGSGRGESGKSKRNNCRSRVVKVTTVSGPPSNTPSNKPTTSQETTTAAFSSTNGTQQMTYL